MGQSTDAILFYGYCWTDEAPNPWSIDGDGGDEEWDVRWARLHGLDEPTDAYPETRDKMGRQRTDLSPAEASVVAKYSAYWNAKDELAKATGCEVATHCSGEHPMPFVAVVASKTKAWRGHPREIEGTVVDPAWKPMLDEFCRKMDIATDGMKATWWLVSDWS